MTHECFICVMMSSSQINICFCLADIFALYTCFHFEHFHQHTVWSSPVQRLAYSECCLTGKQKCKTPHMTLHPVANVLTIIGVQLKYVHCPLICLWSIEAKFKGILPNYLQGVFITINTYDTYLIWVNSRIFSGLSRMTSNTCTSLSISFVSLYYNTDKVTKYYTDSNTRLS